MLPVLAYIVKKLSYNKIGNNVFWYSFAIYMFFSVFVCITIAYANSKLNKEKNTKNLLVSPQVPSPTPTTPTAIKKIKANSNNMAYLEKSQALELEKRNIRNKIYRTKKILKQIAKKKYISVGQLNIINSQIRNKQNLTDIIKKEIALLSTNITAKHKQINILDKQLKDIKIDYENTIFESVKLRNKIDKILFIFSAKSFNDLFLKIKYINQYNEFRRKYFKKASIIKDNLKIERIETKNKIKKAEKLYLQYQKEQKDFLIIKKAKTAIVSSLNKKAKELELELERYNEAIGAVAAVVKKTIAKDIKPNKKPPIKPQAHPISKKLIIRGSFSNYRGKLIWPVKSGIITKKFGKWRHPVLRKGMVENPGIDIQTEPGSMAYAIFPGIIKAVVFVPGMQQLVIVGHGKYHIVYAKLATAEVKVGQIIKLGDAVGKVHTNTEGITELQFQIWYGQKTLNPETWLAKN